MKEEIKVTLPRPCYEDWSKMTQTEKGKFCDVCQKNVFDFTKASDLEIVNTLNENKNICGRFYTSQLNRNLKVTKQKKTFWINAVASLITFLGIGNHSAKAQIGILTIDNHPNRIYYRNILSPSDSIFPKDKLHQNKICSGIVCDKNGKPLSGVLIGNTRTNQSVFTDEMGNFSIPLENDDTLVCIDGYEINDEAIITILKKRGKKKEEEEN